MSTQQLIASAETEQAFVARLRRRPPDNSAYEALFRMYGQSLRTRAFALTGSVSKAEDIVQDTFLTAYEHIDGFQESSKLSTWLTQICINKALNVQRKNKDREHPIELDESRHEHQLLTAMPTIEEELIRTEAIDWLRRAIRSLPRRFREVVILRDLEEVDVKSASEILGASQSAIKMRGVRAKKHLKDEMLAMVHPRPILRPIPIRAMT